MAMNYPQNAFSTQFMQSPSLAPQYGAPSATAATNVQPTPPQWETEMMQEIRQMKQTLTKIDSIETTVNKIHSKVDDLEVKVKNLGTRLDEVENSNAYLSEQYDDATKQPITTDNEIKSLDEKCKTFKETFQTMENQTKELEEKMNDLESRSLRDNLLFYGFEKTNDENCETIIQGFIHDKLSIAKKIPLERVHRIGLKSGTCARPIVAKLHSYKDRELVRTTAGANRDLRADGLGVGIQQTKAVLAKKRELYPIRQREINAGKSVKWSGAKLMVKDGHNGNFREITN